MVNNTSTYWEADGVSLHTFAHSIETLGGALGVPKLRGDDITIPYNHGDLWVPKFADSRVLNLGMWVRGVNPGEGVGANDLSKSNFDSNWNNLVRMLWTPGRQFKLTKRFYDQWDGTLRSASAMAEFSDGLEPTMKGRNLGKFTVSLRLADPFFYDDVIQSFTLVDGDQDINVRGNAPTRNILMTVNGPNKYAQVRRKLPAPDHQVQVYQDILSGGYTQVDPRAWSSLTHPPTGVNYDSQLDIKASGNAPWLELSPGSNTINLTRTSGTGTVILEVRGAWT